MKDRVNVLLATYNGAPFLEEQLQSILLQTLPPARITIRDDSSTDTTYSQLVQWSQGRPLTSLSRGPRIGLINNFFTLLMNADDGCDYFAFCDQDDVWLPEKLECAVAALRKRELPKPMLYCSQVEYVDSRLRHLAYSRVANRLGLANALVENVATGCTMVLNRRARDLICAALPECVSMHDWWCYIVVSALGEVVFDAWPSVKYRQHSNNAVGAVTSTNKLLRQRFSRVWTQKTDARLFTAQALEFERCFGDLLSPRDRCLLGHFLSVRGSLWARVSYNAVMDVWRQRWPDTMILRAMILMGRV